MEYQFWLLFLANVCSLIFFYWKSYLSESAKNIATKEHIEEITTKVEGIRSEFEKQNDVVKSLLQMISQHTLSLKDAEREAIFDFNRIVTEFIIVLYRFEISKYNITNYKELILLKEEIQVLDKRLTLSFFHLKLFISNTDAQNLLTIFDTEVIGYSDSILSSIDELITRYTKLEVIIDNEETGLYQENIENEKKALEEYKTEVNKILERKVKRLVPARESLVSALIQRIRTIETKQYNII